MDRKRTMGKSPATIRRAVQEDAGIVAAAVKALTDEIIERTRAQHFNVDLPQTEARLRDFLESGRYAVYVAECDGACVGFAALCESHALYAEGTFGIVQEFYVAPDVRSAGVGQQLIDAAVAHGRRAGWTRLELCTPPLPEFDRALQFYERNGFEVTGGRKMKRILGT
jgi:GNAT superfamily N-acetyltransferase